MNARTPNALNQQGGTAMIEVLVTLLILLIGLLGLAGLQMQAQRSEMESYQRVQALVLLQDMVGRINANRKVASCYAVTTDTTNGTPFLGTSSTIVTPACAAGTVEQNAMAVQDMQDWQNLLLGAAETAGGNNVGAMIGARGCVSPVPGDLNLYTVTVAWQGLGKTFAPDEQNCGTGLYGDETQRRVVSLTVRIANLS